MKRTIALGVLVGTAACGLFDPRPIPILTGSVSYIYAIPGAYATLRYWYPGEIGVERTAVGRVRVYIETTTPIWVGFPGNRGTFSSFAVGDSVIMWYDPGGAVLTSDPPVWPVTSIEIVK